MSDVLPLLIFEGPDCVGKTTLARYVARQLGAMYFHATASHTLVVAMQDYQKNVIENAETCITEIGIPCVIDRHWPSEVCYGKILRPTNPHGFNPSPFDAAIQRMGGLYIFCMSEFHLALARYKNHVDPDHPYDPLIYTQIYNEYYDLIGRMVAANREDLLMYSIEEYGANMKNFLALIHARHRGNISRSQLSES